ncbi:uncharacterized protein M421DRAFT_414867 [Didymella exigua CBS 183.55]|uniref:Uncharacterized protein n=1 Tax=Didymella exigua CBS 183.55 TaxID=1150837 RepID=A0A6A5S109_9PLEO|nr:uncharacterized protein M421DRAFT_414867 [Didymella exigua CBS 183.55]KAF1933812.1 hypothetical protein M421DRAFT_414867 [Didymella exigua CBS 183.55]
MPSFAYHHTRSRSRSRERTLPPLPRRTSFKRQRLFPSDSDEEYDDYPYSGAHRPSRALVTRSTPSQLERWNIWSSPHREQRCDSGAEETSHERRRRRASFADRVNEDGEREIRVRVARLRERETRLSPLPARCRAESDDERVRPSVWSAELFRRDRCVSEDYEARERARSRSRERRREKFWDGDDEDELVDREFDGERVVRYRRIKRTRTDEWRPLSGWRRS